MGAAYLLTGEPGIGKTTALKKIIDLIGHERCGGFYTQELRADGVRTGFQVVTLSGITGTIAAVTSPSSLRVGKYGVDLQSLEAVGVGSIYDALRMKEYIIIDEIGPMQLFSEAFKHAVLDVLASPKLLIGTVVQRPFEWANELKERSSVQLYTLTLETRDEIAETVSRLISQSSSRQPIE
jgi:nucleoside-triphosphatase